MNHVRSLSVLMLVVLAACANPADDKPQADVQEPVAAAKPAGTGVAYTLTEESTLGFVGSKITGSHDGGFNSFEGAIRLVDGAVEASGVEIQIDATSIWTDNDQLTGHLKSDDFFGVEAHPAASFRSTQIVAEGDGYSVTGNLDLHGVTKSITFPATIEVSEEAVRAQAEFVIMRFDFGIEYKGKVDDLIRDEVVIRFDLHAVPAGA